MTKQAKSKKKAPVKKPVIDKAAQEQFAKTGSASPAEAVEKEDKNQGRMTLHIKKEYRIAIRVACGMLDISIKDFVEQAIKEKLQQVEVL